MNTVRVHRERSWVHERVDTSKARAATALHTPERISGVDEDADGAKGENSVLHDVLLMCDKVCLFAVDGERLPRYLAEVICRDAVVAKR
jgi:hypothetical protein